ncbi:SURF1 family protein [Porticoccus sp. W117]|uniref:SURF1 family protein n=1 Tax=Porticoccus sp. W117 TaxID=3054777 RepID=UPI00259AB749|nr:SURF1 family protein [Porticoccus sp. W117]MDM3870816.1 SURF1 family protein [Porticoccus sp. W117]
MDSGHRAYKDVCTACLAKITLSCAPPNSMKRHFAPNAKILILAALLLPVLLYLGNWQLGRAEEKRNILTQLQARTALPPVAAQQLIGEADVRYRNVRATGSFDNRHNFLLDNRVRDARPGYEVVTPLYTDSGHWLLVNRGWVAAPAYRDQLPEIPAITGPVALTATAHTPLEKAPSVYDSQPGWPKVIQSINVAQMGKELGHKVAPFTLRMQDNQPGALRTGWAAINVQPEKHTAYAVQWFAMALALLILTALFCFPKKRPSDD